MVAPRVLEPGFILTERFTSAGLEQTLAQARSPHALRHSFVTLAIRGGASVTQAQAAARHKDPRTPCGMRTTCRTWMITPWIM